MAARLRTEPGSPRAAAERTINNFHDHPLYIQALVQRIGSVLAAISGQLADSFGFSAHGLPMSLVEKGDPYPKQIEETVGWSCEVGRKAIPGWPETHLLCYQSRVGPAKWLQPPLTGTIERLGHGRRQRNARRADFVCYRAHRDACTKSILRRARKRRNSASKFSE